MFAVVISVVQLVSLINALVRSIRDRFLAGALGAVVRGASSPSVP